MCMNCDCSDCQNNNSDKKAAKRNIKRVRKGKMSVEQRMNAEFKHLKLRIKKLEQLVLNQKQDNGSITDPVKKLTKG